MLNVFALCGVTLESSAEIFIRPTAAFGARLIFGENVLVGAFEGEISDFLPVKEATSDRTILEFNLAGEHAAANKVYLNFYLRSMDPVRNSSLSLYTFEGDGTANPSDYYRLDHHVSDFTDQRLEGVATCQFRWTSRMYNASIGQQSEILGFNLKANDLHTRYFLNEGEPMSAVGRAISLHQNPLPSTGIVDAIVTPRRPFETTLMVLGATVSFDYWWEMGGGRDQRERSSFSTSSRFNRVVGTILAEPQPMSLRQSGKPRFSTSLKICRAQSRNCVSISRIWGRSRIQPSISKTFRRASVPCPSPPRTR